MNSRRLRVKSWHASTCCQCAAPRPAWSFPSEALGRATVVAPVRSKDLRLTTPWARDSESDHGAPQLRLRGSSGAASTVTVAAVVDARPALPP